MSKLMINNNIPLNYPIVCDSYANMNNALDIWIKFSKYLTDEELLFMHKLKGKNIDSLPQNEFNEYSKIRRQLEFSNILPKYKNKKCTKDEHDFVVEFMKNTLLQEFVNSKFTDEQKDNAKQFISNLVQKQELEQFIESQEVQYDSLNIYDSYVLFVAKEERYAMIQKEANEKIRSEQIDRANSLRKNLIRDYGLNS